MSLLADLKPTKKHRVIDLLQQAGHNIDEWSSYAGPPAANPKYCYNWSFQQEGKPIVVCIWHADLKIEDDVISHEGYRGIYASVEKLKAGSVRERRSRHFDDCFRVAFEKRLPVRVIVLDGSKRNPQQGTYQATVTGRLLDSTEWAVVTYDGSTGRRLLVRGADPVNGEVEVTEADAWFEGQRKEEFIIHRKREARLRAAKIRHALKQNGGRLICEVKGCNFDFVEHYGAIGQGYAQVHHLSPLSAAPAEGKEVKLEDLAIVCANCHAMIHWKGECRPLGSLISAS